MDTYSTDTWITDGSPFKKLASPPNQQYAILGGDATYKKPHHSVVGHRQSSTRSSIDVAPTHQSGEDQRGGVEQNKGKGNDLDASAI